MTRGPFTWATSDRTFTEYGVHQLERRAWLESREYRSFALVEPTNETGILSLAVGYDEADPAPHKRQQIRLNAAQATYLAECLLRAAAGCWSFTSASNLDSDLEDIVRPRDL